MNTCLTCLAGLMGVDATVSHNKLQNGIEVKFKTNPGDDTIRFLKSAGFRWSKFQKLWYARYNDALYKKVMEKFHENQSTGTESTTPRAETPKPVLTEKEKANERLAHFKNQLEKYPSSPASSPTPLFSLGDLVDIYQAGLHSFLKNPREYITIDVQYKYDSKKGAYWHLPPKRKRPDIYSPAQIFKKIIYIILRNGGIVDMADFLEFPYIPDSIVGFERKITENPQMIHSPQYQNVLKYYQVWEVYRVEEEYNFQTWFATYIRPLAQSKKPHYITFKGNKKTVSIQDQNYFGGISPSRSKSTITVQEGGGYVVFSYIMFPENVYDENNKPLTELYPLPANKHPKPDFEKYMKGDIPAKVIAPAKVHEEMPKGITMADIPDIVKKIIPAHQQEAILGNREIWDVLKRLEYQANMAAKPKDSHIGKLLDKFRNKGGHKVGYNDFAIVWLHYFYGGSDWFIVEWPHKSYYFSGYVILNNDSMMSEYGDIGVEELTKNGRVELDFYWKPVPLNIALHKADPDFFGEKPDYFEKFGIDKETLKILTEESKKEVPASTDSDKRKKMFKLKLKAKAIKVKLLITK